MQLTMGAAMPLTGSNARDITPKCEAEIPTLPVHCHKNSHPACANWVGTMEQRKKYRERGKTNINIQYTTRQDSSQLKSH